MSAHSRLLLIALLVGHALVGVILGSTAGAEASERLTPAQWREDLAVLDQALRSDHKNPFHTVSEADFAAMVQSLHEEIPSLSDQEIIVGMASIVASINDGHTRLNGWYQHAEWGFHSYPVALYWFEDGLFVRQAHPDHAELVGARVLEIGAYSAAEAQAVIERVVPADNAYGERAGGPYYLICPEVLQALGITKAGVTAPYLLDKDGRSWRPELLPLSDPWPGWNYGFVAEYAGWADASASAEQETPLWRRHIDEIAWFEYFPDEKILYVQQNQVRNPPSETLESFYARVWDAVESHEVDKLVLDLRLNGGGNNYLNKPALTMMVRADAVTQTFTVLGRETFSACQNLVNELSRWTDTVFVGEPTGERVNFYGDTRSTELPNSGLTVRASWLWWQNLDPRDTRDALYPDLAADLSSIDYATHHDPVMEAIGRFESLLSDEEILMILDEQGLAAVQDALRDVIRDPVSRYGKMESRINDLGYELMGRMRLDDAIGFFELNVEEFPDSWNVYDSLGEAYETRGERQRALQLFRTSLSLNPTSPTGLAAVARLESELGTSSARQD